MLAKTMLVDRVQNNIKMFNRTNNNNFIIEATIIYAIYRAMGGKKLIALPPFTDSLYNIIKAVGAVKFRCSNDDVTLQILEKARLFIMDQIDEIKSIELFNDGTTRLSTNKGSYVIMIDNSLSTWLARIALINIVETQDFKIQGTCIENIIREYLYNMGRN